MCFVHFIFDQIQIPVDFLRFVHRHAQIAQEAGSRLGEAFEASMEGVSVVLTCAHVC